MENLRTYGNPPYRVAVVHGGPGAPGEMAPVARELASLAGVLEPLQAAATLDGQVAELRKVLEENADTPLVLIGWSWGAWLSFIVAARHPAPVGKLILVAGGPFEERYAGGIMPTRLERMTEVQRREVFRLADVLSDPSGGDKDAAFARLGEIIARSDTFDPLPYQSELLEVRYDIYQGVWPEADELRNSGELLRLGEKVRCPVVAIHGDYDPRPAAGVRDPLSRVLEDFRFILLEKCGHEPWREKDARDRFYKILKSEVTSWL
ncbi:MAG TPA: alpha/beta hydrolase [Dehalococcoidales bacterium]|nr:alpha/beta hydrolase [Dehalococcoidales bacterium]